MSSKKRKTNWNKSKNGDWFYHYDSDHLASIKRFNSLWKWEVTVAFSLFDMELIHIYQGTTPNLRAAKSEVESCYRISVFAIDARLCARQMAYDNKKISKLEKLL